MHCINALYKCLTSRDSGWVDQGRNWEYAFYEQLKLSLMQGPQNTLWATLQ